MRSSEATAAPNMAGVRDLIQRYTTTLEAPGLPAIIYRRLPRRRATLHLLGGTQQ